MLSSLKKTYKTLYTVEGNEWNVFAYGDGVSKKVELRISNEGVWCCGLDCSCTLGCYLTLLLVWLLVIVWGLKNDLLNFNIYIVIYFK